jgi:drug/metabolite transporter (DMT)-like permease
MTGERTAVVAGLYAGICFGVFWIPIRALEMAGFAGPWSMVVFAGLPLIACIPVVWRFRDVYVSAGAVPLLGGLIGGIAFALYAIAFLYTDVVRVIVMFYAMPAWGFLLAWIFLGDRITSVRWLSLALCFSGLYVVFGSHTGVPLPQNLGDWMALLSGILWAVAALMILIHQRVGYLVHATNFFASAMIVSLLAALIATIQGTLSAPNWNGFADAVFWVVPLALFLILPAGVATVFAPTRLNPGVAGILFMTEVVVAAITAAIWADEVLGTREVLGLVLIMSAGLMEPATIFLVKEKAHE